MFGLSNRFRRLKNGDIRRLLRKRLQKSRKGLHGKKLIAKLKRRRSSRNKPLGRKRRKPVIS